jgi:hypothetical protein
LPHVAVGIEIAASVVSRVVQVLHVRVVSTKGIGGGGSLGIRSAGVVAVVVRDVVVVVTDSRAIPAPVTTRVAAAAKIRSRMIRILLFLFLKVELKRPR